MAYEATQIRHLVDRAHRYARPRILPQQGQLQQPAEILNAGENHLRDVQRAPLRRRLDLRAAGEAGSHDQLARDHGASGPTGKYPEHAVSPKPKGRKSRRGVAVAAAAVGLAALAAYASRPSR